MTPSSKPSRGGVVFTNYYTKIKMYPGADIRPYSQDLLPLMEFKDRGSTRILVLN